MNRISKRSFFTIVNQAEICYREFLGMNRTQLKPGIRWKLPILHRLQRVDMRERQIGIDLDAYSADNVPVSVVGSLFFKVVDAEKACFNVQDYAEAVQNIGDSVSRVVVGKSTYDQLISDRHKINRELTENIGKEIGDWGVNCTRFEIRSFGPQNSEVAIYLEKQMQAERKRRENELDTLAAIRTAEGKRDAVKLEADAILYQNMQKARAMAERIKILRSAFPESTKVSDLELLQFSLESDRQATLKAIAESKNNTVYVIPPEKMYPVNTFMNMTVKNSQIQD